MERNSDAVAIVLGRTVAGCVHPVAAWGRFSTIWRSLMLTAYAAAGYVIVLSLLLFLK